MRRLAFLALLAIAASPAAADTASLTVQAGEWIQLFTPDVERVIGRSIRVDAASVVIAGTTRSFRQAEVLLRAEGVYPRGTTIYAQRSVDCRAGYAAVVQWSAIDATGRLLAGGAPGVSAVTKVHWDSPDGKTVKFACQGILPR